MGLASLLLQERIARGEVPPPPARPRLSIPIAEHIEARNGWEQLLAQERATSAHLRAEVERLSKRVAQLEAERPAFKRPAGRKR